ncbi:transcriptional regulator, partial [Listeria monocytogenes]|nr:transcriptional regulator [Listeria monocytogenes]
SPKFQILETLLLSSFPNLQVLANEVHVSYSGIKKEIKELNEELRERNLYISTGSQVEITGDEFSLRIFYTFLFLVAYSGDRWPFSFVKYDEITDILES